VRALTELGLGLDRVVAARVFLVDMREFDRMNAVYASYFDDDKRPAWT
jgi:enamine deaminase RidA (YjgF/YER057c/UK114 family)